MKLGPPPIFKHMYVYNRIYVHIYVHIYIYTYTHTHTAHTHTLVQTHTLNNGMGLAKGTCECSLMCWPVKGSSVETQSYTTPPALTCLKAAHHPKPSPLNPLLLLVLVHITLTLAAAKSIGTWHVSFHVRSCVALHGPYAQTLYKAKRLDPGSSQHT